MKTVAFFNNKGGVGKTSLVYHLAWMFSELRVNVVAIDLDPQSNLTASFLNDKELEALWSGNSSSKTVLDYVQPLLERLGDIENPRLVRIDRRIGLIAGNLGLSLFEDRLAETWSKCLDDNVSNSADAFRVTTSFYRIMENAAKQQMAELVLIDVGPNLGAINRAALVAADYVVIPLAADLFSLQGLRNLGPTLRGWRSGWRNRRERTKSIPRNSLPTGEMKPIGYVVMQPSIRENYPVKAYRRWMAKIPDVYQAEVCGMDGCDLNIDSDPNKIAVLKNYRSLAPMAQQARKPMFLLRPADGAIGGHGAGVAECYAVFAGIAKRIAKECEVPMR